MPCVHTGLNSEMPCGIHLMTRSNHELPCNSDLSACINEVLTPVLVLLMWTKGLSPRVMSGAHHPADFMTVGPTPADVEQCWMSRGISLPKWPNQCLPYGILVLC
jgi:hypothetical protein